MRLINNDIVRDWKDERNVSLGMSLCLRPAVSLGDEGFTDDWAVVEVYPSMIGELNFVGNAIDHGAIAVDKLTAWMDPHQSSFNYPGSRLHRFCGLV